MLCTHSTSWTTWIYLLTIGSLQIYIIHSSIYRYVNLKFEVFNAFQARHEDNKWIFSLLNFQLLTIIVFLGLLPIWIYSTIFSSSSFFCGRDVFVNRKGLYQLVWKEALETLGRRNLMEISGKVSCCHRNINVALFFPICNLLQILMAYLLLLPLPFIEAWLFTTNDERKEILGYNNLEFLGSSGPIVKIKCSIEYFNFMFSLLNYSFQFSKLFWSCNKAYSILILFIYILVTAHSLLNMSLFSIFIKLYYKNLVGSHCLLSPTLILLIATLSDAILILSSFSFFQFGFDKCVKYLLSSSWFNSINRLQTVPISNQYEHSNCQSTTSSSVFYTPRNGTIKNNSCPEIVAVTLLFLGIAMKVPGCFEYLSHLKSSPYLMIYLLQSLMMVMFYTMICFGMCLKSDWTFTLTEKQLASYAIITYPEKIESNYYKSLRSHHDNSQISFSMTSNVTDSLQSKQRENVHCPDLPKPNHQISQFTNPNLQDMNKQIRASCEYLQLNNHINRTNVQRSAHSTSSLGYVTSPSMSRLLYKDFSRTVSPNYKYSAQLYPNLRAIEYARSTDQMTRKLDLSSPIKEEIVDDIYDPSDEDVFLDNKQSQKCNEQTKNSLQLKFVTFQLDKNPEITTEYGSSSNEDLTILSLPTSDSFINELDGGTNRNMGHRRFHGDCVMKTNINSIYGQ